MKVNNVSLSKHIKDKMYAEMSKTQQTFGLRYFADNIGIGHATLSRVINDRDTVLALDTFIKICTWLGKSTDDFITK